MYFFYKIFFSLLLFAYLQNISLAQSSWQQRISPTTKNLRNCFFTDPDNGWISGDSGIILHTSNKGIDWTFQNPGFYKDIQSIFFLNNLTGWALAWQDEFDAASYPGTIILKTTNSGINWNQTMYPDTNAYMTSVYFTDSLHGLIGGAPEFIHYTTNGGINWTRSFSDTLIYSNLPVHNIVFYDQQTGYACGGSRDFAGIVWTTTNSGINWSTVLIGPDPVTDIYIVNSDSAFGTGGDFKFGSTYFTTSDLGESWTPYGLGYFGIANAIDFRTKSEGWISLGVAERFFYTTNGGAKWLIQKTPSSSAIYDIAFPDSLNGWAVGNNGVILKYDRLTAINNPSSEIEPDKFTLFQNYPNPFNPVTQINYELKITNYVTLKIFDVIGNEVAALVNEKQTAGNYQVEFNGENLPSGIYFYRLSADAENVTRRMILLK